MSDTPAVSLREARQREAEAEDVATKNYALVNATDYEKLLAARRATDEALVRAVLEWVDRFVLDARLKDGNTRVSITEVSASAVLDAVEKGTDE